MKICVFCSAQEIGPEYSEPSLQAVRLFASNGHGLIWGGSDTGLMKEVASAAQSQGVPIVGVSVEFLKDKARVDADEMTVAKDLSQRKALMISKSDAFLVLPGGLGTLDEVMEIIEYQKHMEVTKPVVFLNVNDFYKGISDQLQRMFNEGFITKTLDQVATFACDPEEAISLLGAAGN